MATDPIPPEIRRELASLAAADRRHDASILKLESDMSEIKATLGETATKEDVANLKNHINELINGILKDALNAAPAWMQAQMQTRTATWTFYMVGITFLGICIGLFKAFHG